MKVENARMNGRRKGLTSTVRVGGGVELDFSHGRREEETMLSVMNK